MPASLIESDDEHHWVLIDHQITQLVVDLRSFRLQTWSLDGSADVRVAAACTLRLGGGGGRTLDPDSADSLAPSLGLLRRQIQSLTATREGELTLEFSNGAALTVRPHPRATAWEVHGGGSLEGLSYRCPPGGGVPWE